MKTRDHCLEYSEGRYHCTVCLWTWQSRPKTHCPGIPRGRRSPHLLTYTQLRAKGLKPRDRDKPDGCYWRSSSTEWIWLYDEREALKRRKETAKQKEAHERTWLVTQEKYRCPQCGEAPTHLGAIKDYRPDGQLCLQCAEWAAYWAEQDATLAQRASDERAACEWAASMLAREDWCILDTETTSLTGYLVEIAVIDRQGKTLFHSLVKPEVPVSEGARVVHQIPDEELAKAPTLPHIWEDFMAALHDRMTIVTFNAQFDKSTLERDTARYGLVMPKAEWQCLMLRYAEYVGEWSQYHGNYRWQRLPGGDHRALGDALAALEVMRHMAVYLERLDREQGQEVP
jgi:DNA polymerase III subunit epsilon